MKGEGVEKVSALESPVVLVRLQQLVSVEEAALVAAHAAVKQSGENREQGNHSAAYSTHPESRNGEKGRNRAHRYTLLSP